MVPAVPTLKKRPEFLRVAATRRKWVTPGLILQERVRVNPGETEGVEAKSGQGSQDGLPSIRIGFTVSKKVGNAVARNRARRRLRAVAGQVVPKFGLAGRDYVLIGRRETVKRPFADLLIDLETALQLIGRKGGGRKKGAANRSPTSKTQASKSGGNALGNGKEQG